MSDTPVPQETIAPETPATTEPPVTTEPPATTQPPILATEAPRDPSADIKAWVRREISLASCGVDESERATTNP